MAETFSRGFWAFILVYFNYPAVSGLIPLKAAAAESSAACQIKRFI